MYKCTREVTKYENNGLKFVLVEGISYVEVNGVIKQLEEIKTVFNKKEEKQTPSKKGSK